MTGLFFRLARQHINKRPPGIAPLSSPVFPVHFNEEKAGVVDEYEGTVPQSRNSKPGVQTRKTESVLHDAPAKLASNAMVKVKPDIDRPGKDTAVKAPSLTPFTDPLVNEVRSNEHVTPLARTTQMKPGVPETIQAQSPSDSLSPSISPVSDGNREGYPASDEESDLPTGDKLVSKRLFESHQALPPSLNNSNEQPTGRFTKLEHQENQTTINVSIGQIDVKATREEKPGRKTPSRPARVGSSALEEYHQKRVRGER